MTNTFKTIECSSCDERTFITPEGIIIEMSCNSSGQAVAVCPDLSRDAAIAAVPYLADRQGYGRDYWHFAIPTTNSKKAFTGFLGHDDSFGQVEIPADWTEC